jgi:beta-1,4-mannooligosaccharide/beta-1,4-mannosyl-N-acetylglucosamine phosphorylase
MLSRPNDNGHTPFGDIFISQSLDLIHWGQHRFVMGVKSGWQSTKIGAGPVHIETPDGWLWIYHGGLTSCNGYV